MRWDAADGLGSVYREADGQAGKWAKGGEKPGCEAIGKFWADRRDDWPESGHIRV